MAGPEPPCLLPATFGSSLGLVWGRSETHLLFYFVWPLWDHKTGLGPLYVCICMYIHIYIYGHSGLRVLISICIHVSIHIHIDILFSNQPLIRRLGQFLWRVSGALDLRAALAGLWATAGGQPHGSDENFP